MDTLRLFSIAMRAMSRILSTPVVCTFDPGVSVRVGNTTFRSESVPQAFLDAFDAHERDLRAAIERAQRTYQAFRALRHMVAILASSTATEKEKEQAAEWLIVVEQNGPLGVPLPVVPPSEAERAEMALVVRAYEAERDFEVALAQHLVMRLVTSAAGPLRDVEVQAVPFGDGAGSSASASAPTRLAALAQLGALLLKADAPGCRAVPFQEAFTRLWNLVEEEKAQPPS